MNNTQITSACFKELGCRGGQTGICSMALQVDGQADYFDKPQIHDQFTKDGFETFLQNMKHNALPYCKYENQLTAAIARARKKAAAHFSSRSL